MRGTFANVRIKNLILPKKTDGSVHEGGDTILFPDMKKMSIYEAAMKYLKRNVPTIILEEKNTEPAHPVIGLQKAPSC